MVGVLLLIKLTSWYLQIDTQQNETFNLKVLLESIYFKFQEVS